MRDSISIFLESLFGSMKYTETFCLSIYLNLSAPFFVLLSSVKVDSAKRTAQSIASAIMAILRINSWSHKSKIIATIIQCVPINMIYNITVYWITHYYVMQMQWALSIFRETELSFSIKRTFPFMCEPFKVFNNLVDVIINSCALALRKCQDFHLSIIQAEAA